MAISCRKAFRVCERWDFSCAYCNDKPGRSGLQIDHLIPRARGGSDDEDNLVPACVACNQGKSDSFYVPPALRITTDDDGCHVVFQKGAWGIKIGLHGAFLSGAVYHTKDISRSCDCYDLGVGDVWDTWLERHVADKAWPKPHSHSDFLVALELFRRLIRSPVKEAAHGR